MSDKEKLEAKNNGQDIPFDGGTILQSNGYAKDEEKEVASETTEDEEKEVPVEEAVAEEPEITSENAVDLAAPALDESIMATTSTETDIDPVPYIPIDGIPQTPVEMDNDAITATTSSEFETSDFTPNGLNINDPIYNPGIVSEVSANDNQYKSSFDNIATDREYKNDFSNIAKYNDLIKVASTIASKADLEELKAATKEGQNSVIDEAFKPLEASIDLNEKADELFAKVYAGAQSGDLFDAIKNWRFEYRGLKQQKKNFMDDNNFESVNEMNEFDQFSGTNSDKIIQFPVNDMNDNGNSLAA